MSVLKEIQGNLSQSFIRSKLSIEERAQLLIDITDSIGWDTYIDKSGKENLNKAKLDLKLAEKEFIKNGW
jgi:hypothetical protein